MRGYEQDMLDHGRYQCYLVSTGTLHEYMGKFESGAHFGGTKYRWVGLLLMRFFTLFSSFSVPCMRRNQSL